MKIKLLKLFRKKKKTYYDPESEVSRNRYF